ncbi:glycosyltransferase [Rufibacter sp. XAAS-G3-1]|uniref:glycosyltransferase n=1 Tax=Rufibacter sp. XAAS-G3-1 TaxID=2729134 RepID=UPI0015E71F7B|nr:glycosyltransferase [Rufibacter sp. XAAS-G3-1]
MNKNYDIILVSTSRWDNPYSSVGYSFAKEFAKSNRVFYIDHPISIKEFLSEYSNGDMIKSRKGALLYGKNKYRKIEGTSDKLVVVTPKLTLPINWLKEGAVYDYLSKLNDKIVYSTIRELVKDYNIKEYVFFNSYDPFFFASFPEDIKPKIKVYQTIDDISQETYIARHGIRLEKEQARSADITLATSRELSKSMSKYSDKVYCIPNAADFSLFQRAVSEKLNKPKELVGVSKKVITYTGNIGTRINYPLLIEAAKIHHDKILMMVGPVSTDDFKKSGLDQLPNVVFTGAKDINDLPAYLQHSDCLLIPFEYSLLTKSIYPLKVNEYLTSGKPVISTAFSDDIKDFADVAYIAENETQFISMIDKALQEDSLELVEKRIEKAQTNTWEARVHQFWRIIDEVEAS